MPQSKDAHLPTNLPKRVTTPVTGELSKPNYHRAEKIVIAPVEGRSFYGSVVDGQEFVDADHTLGSSGKDLSESQRPVGEKIGSKGRTRVSMYEEILATLGYEAAQRYLHLPLKR